MNDEEKCYNHSMIFGQLLTGSNYDDEEERIISGRNGLGIKLCNVFSVKFCVKGCDPNNKKLLDQEWTNNMRTTSGPKISNTRLKKGYTEVIWTPDFAKFSLKGYTKDIVRLYTKFVVDAAMLSKVSVYLNDNLIPFKNLSEYSKLYQNISEEKLYIKTKTTEVLVTPSTEFQAISFVNGVYTKLGGKHVDAWSEALFRPIVDKFNGKGGKKTKKTPKININDVKQFFKLFIVTTVVRPEFDSQDKNKLESPEIEAVVKRTHITAMSGWSVIDRIEDLIKAKEMTVLKKAEKTSNKTKIDNYDRANKAGGKESKNCSLFICEGLSAKTYVVAGIEQGIYDLKGRDWFGILPLTGKLLNVRNATSTSIASNKVISNIIHAMGLKHGVDYTDDSNFKKLNYGKIIIVTDADVDGIHIEGLIMNFIHSLYPSLLQRKEPFLISMKTPICRIKKSGKDMLFYDERRFHKWMAKQTTKIQVKYYKGLGTTKTEDVPDTFGLKMIEYKPDENSFSSMQKVFHKKHSDARKIWLSDYDPSVSHFSLDDIDKIKNMSITDFINWELIKFSHADCARSIPNGIDGLKESQRKILYSAKKRRLLYSGKSLKVAQFGGYTAEHSNYHRGEQNLFDTITGMANAFPGSNNIPLLYRDGQFGSRLTGGKDAASARYIFTKMDMLTQLIYRDEDEPLLTQVNDDGDLVQPEHYIPIIPMILVNGCIAGIGTGWSCNIPCYNPLDLINCIKTWIEYEGEVLVKDPDEDSIISMFPEISPWYRGFKGEIQKDSDNRYVTYGMIKESRRDTVEITELPVATWTSNFKSFCDDLKADKKLKEVLDYSTPKDVHFILRETPGFRCDLQTLKLHSYLYISNMVLFNEKNQLKKYDTIDQILDNFCQIRYTYYIKRKKYQIKVLEEELRYLGNKARFIREIIEKKLLIMNRKECDIISDLVDAKYDEDPKKAEGEGGYDYLLRLHVRTFTIEKVTSINNDISNLKNKLKKLKNISEYKMWLNELSEFEVVYGKWLKVIENEKVGKGKKK